MEAHVDDGSIVVEGPQARQQLYHASGVGRPHGTDEVLVSWAEAVYLLERGDIDGIDGDGLAAVLATPPDRWAVDRWLVYRDLRERGYYVSTAYDLQAPGGPGAVTFTVRPRGADPTSDAVAHRIGVVDETTRLAIADLTGVTLAVADDEGAVTYLGVEAFDPTGDTLIDTWSAPTGIGCGSRVIVPDPPSALGDPAFFGRSFDAGGRLLNAIEARYLAERDRLELAELPTVGTDRYRVYTDLRDSGCVPRSGLKFGADFRVYTDVTDADDPGHSAFLVDVHPAEATVSARELSRAVRLAGGVRKRHVVALVEDESIAYLGVERRRL